LPSFQVRNTGKQRVIPGRPGVWNTMSFRVLVILLVVKLIAGQNTTAVCLSSWSWATNSLDQNPCLVAAYLLGVCQPNFTVDAIPAGYHYAGPLAEEDNSCKCSTVTYSLVSACSGCQNGTIESWTTWSFNCSQVYQEFIENIPSETAVPSWAYLDVIIADTFDPVTAQADTDAPESTGMSEPTTTSGSSVTTASFKLRY